MKTETEFCPICEAGILKELADHTYRFKHGRKTHVVNELLHSVCPECGATMFLPEQMRLNNLRVRDFQSRLEDYISPAEILELREQYDLTQQQANQIFGGGPTAFSKYERGISNPTNAASRQMRNALRDPSYMLTLAEARCVTITASANAKIPPSRGIIDFLPANLRCEFEQYAGRVKLSLQDACVALIRKGIEASVVDQHAYSLPHTYKCIVADYKKQDFSLPTKSSVQHKAEFVGVKKIQKEFRK